MTDLEVVISRFGHYVKLPSKHSTFLGACEGEDFFIVMEQFWNNVPGYHTHLANVLYVKFIKILNFCSAKQLVRRYKKAITGCSKKVKCFDVFFIECQNYISSDFLGDIRGVCHISSKYIKSALCIYCVYKA